MQNSSRIITASVDSNMIQPIVSLVIQGQSGNTVSKP